MCETMMEKIAAVIVTYNRKDKLRRCIDAVRRQTAEVKPDIIVVDNASSDGTGAMMEDYIARYCPADPFDAESQAASGSGCIKYYNLGYNSGGAGGFCYGIRKAVESGYGLVWLMDDDCVPADDALEQLLDFGSRHKDFGFLSSRALWKDGTPCEMNVQRRTVFRDIRKDTERPAQVEMASFVSLLIPARVIADVGLPIRQFFIWTDDWEYTRRISRKYPCWMVPGSAVIHDTDQNTGADIASAPEDRTGRFRYLYRNDVYLYRREGIRGAAYESARLMFHAAGIAVSSHSFDEKLRRVGIMLKGTAEGLRFFPDPERVFLPTEISGTGEPYVRQAESNDLKILEAFGEPISYGGQETFVMNVLEHMDRTGITADLLTPYYCDNDLIPDRVSSLGGTVYCLECEFRPGSLRVSEVSAIKEFLQSHSYDVIHIHSGSNTMLAMYAALAYEAGIDNIIVHSHCTGIHGWKHFASKTVTSYALRRYPSSYCACSREAGEWRFPADICSKNLNVISNGIDTDSFRYDEEVRRAVRAELGIDDDTVLMGCVGRLTYQKNQSFLIDVLKCAAERAKRSEIGLKYKLILIGDGEDRNILSDKIAKNRLSGDVIFTGAVSNVRDYLQAMDLDVMPSRYEGLAIAVIEAQAAGLEIIASDNVPEEAAVTQNVTFLPADDPEVWADALMKPHARHPEQADLVKSGGYSIEDTAAKVRELYRSAYEHR